MSIQQNVSLQGLLELLDGCVQIQHKATKAWHTTEPCSLDWPTETEATPKTLYRLVQSQHLCNFQLWHVEDIARRNDVGPEVIADCKRRIDGLNQRRNDGMERIDACWNALLLPLLPAYDEKRPINTESLGMAMDRLSILSLKVWHMAEQLERSDVDEDHIKACSDKLAVLTEQRKDLQEAISVLMGEYVEGRKQPKVYYQCKMYNDPKLNPELYQQR